MADEGCDDIDIKDEPLGNFEFEQPENKDFAAATSDEDLQIYFEAVDMAPSTLTECGENGDEALEISSQECEESDPLGSELPPELDPEYYENNSHLNKNEDNETLCVISDSYNITENEDLENGCVNNEYYVENNDDNSYCENQSGNCEGEFIDSNLGNNDETTQVQLQFTGQLETFGVLVDDENVNNSVLKHESSAENSVLYKCHVNQSPDGINFNTEVEENILVIPTTAMPEIRMKNFIMGDNSEEKATNWTGNDDWLFLKAGSSGGEEISGNQQTSDIGQEGENQQSIILDDSTNEKTFLLESSNDGTPFNKFVAVCYEQDEHQRPWRWQVSCPRLQPRFHEQPKKTYRNIKPKGLTPLLKPGTKFSSNVVDQIPKNLTDKNVPKKISINNKELQGHNFLRNVSENKYRVNSVVDPPPTKEFCPKIQQVNVLSKKSSRKQTLVPKLEEDKKDEKFIHKPRKQTIEVNDDASNDDHLYISCTNCKKTFFHEYRFNDHTELFVRRKKCRLCSEVFDNVCELDTHYLSHSTEGKLNCCRLKYSDFCTSKAHLLHYIKLFDDTESGQFICFCKYKFSSRKRLVFHIEGCYDLCKKKRNMIPRRKRQYYRRPLHTSSRPIMFSVEESVPEVQQVLPKCRICKTEFYNRYEYLEHVRFDHFQNYSCELCSFSVDSKSKQPILRHIIGKHLKKQKALISAVART